MSNQFEKAISLLNENDYTCVVVKDEDILFSRDRGVKPLLVWIEEDKDLTGFSAADKVVGKGAAMLYVLLNIKELYASVISKSAYDFLKNNDIEVRYENLVERITNRTKTGFCPIEEVVMDIEDPKVALVAIKDRLKSLSK